MGRKRNGDGAETGLPGSAAARTAGDGPEDDGPEDDGALARRILEAALGDCLESVEGGADEFRVRGVNAFRLLALERARVEVLFLLGGDTFVGWSMPAGERVETEVTVRGPQGDARRRVVRSTHAVIVAMRVLADGRFDARCGVFRAPLSTSRSYLRKWLIDFAQASARKLADQVFAASAACGIGPDGTLRWMTMALESAAHAFERTAGSRRGPTRR
jgi:hypothetical protein